MRVLDAPASDVVATATDAAPSPARAPASAPDAGRAWPGLLFLACVVLGVVPIWLVGHVPTQDGGNHVESVLGLLRLPHSALLQRHDLPNYGLQPNWLTQIMLAALVQVVSPAVGEKLILSGYLVLLPVAFRAALPRTRRGDWAALLIFPFLHSYTFHMGFWNFSYSVALFFVAVGYWYRARGRLNGRRIAAFTAITTLLFVAHSVSTASAFAAMTAVLAWRAGLALWRTRGRQRRGIRVLRGYVRRAVTTYLCAAPALALMALFLARQPRPYSARPTLFEYVKHLASLYGLVSFDRRELIATCTLVAVLAAALVVAIRRRRRERRLVRPVDGWLAAAALATLVYFAVPDSVADGAQLNDRLMLYPFFALLLWLGWSSQPVRSVRRLAIAVTVLFAVSSAFRVYEYRRLDAYLDDYLSVAPQIAEGSTILPLTFAPFGPRRDGLVDGKKLVSYRVQPFTHVSGYVATARHGVDLDNSQANTHHTPLRWRHERNPFTYLNTEPFGLEREPPCVELWPYAALGGRIDYVLVWGATPAHARDECGAALLRELATRWRRTYVSPLGMAQLFRPAPEGSPGEAPSVPFAALPSE